MDHNLEDSLNLESDIGMDFETAEDVVVSQKDITLASSNQEGDMAMEFEHIEEQPILMDAGNEEIIISDFMGDQFHLQEYSIHDDQTTGMTTTEDSNQQSLLANQSESIDLQFNTQGITPVRLGVTGKPKYIAVKAATPSIAPKKFDISNQPIAPRQIAIAPKLPKLVPAVGGVRGLTVPQPKQVTIAPKPVSLVMNKKSFVKKVPISTVVKDPSQAGTVLAQIGKQLVMVPTSIGGQKIKLVTTGSSGMSTVQYINADSDQAQLIPTQNITGIYDRTAKPVMAKVIVQGQSTDASNQPAVITKLVGAPAAAARYVMQRKTVRVSLSGGKDVVMASPTKQGITYMKKQQVKPFKSPPPPQVVTAQAAGTAAKLIMATSAATSTQNVILKTTAPTKMITKDGKVVMQNQRSQLHQINVPGKGIQYIRLITNQNPVAAKGAQPAGTANFVLSDNKTGHLVQVSGAKAGAPPPLLYTTAGAATNKRPQKLVRLAAAPLTVKATLVSQASRSSQSLLAPLSSTETQPQPQPVDSATESLHAIQPDPSQALQLETLEEYEVAESTAEAEEEPVADSLELEETDSKAALHALINATHDSTAAHAQNAEDSENSNSMEHFVPIERSEHPLIVISSNFMKQEAVLGDEQSRQQQDDSNQMNRSMNIETDILNTYQPSTTPPPMTDGDVISDELGFKPRRACNCTKSRCLKLYCDCFANGEFCNSCNCNNCHNNLDNEELRQKAIRACLERNPNAFRPKIGKTKAGGPEIIRRHNKGCNCKRSGCLKNYCECYEAKIACTAMCKCVGCRNVEDGLQSRRAPPALYRPPAHQQLKQPCSFMTTEVIEAVCQCLIAASTDSGERADTDTDVDPVRDVIEEFSRCLQDVISASHHAAPLLDEVSDVIIVYSGRCPVRDVIIVFSGRRPVRDVIEEFSRCLQDVISASHHAAPLLDEA